MAVRKHDLLAKLFCSAPVLDLLQDELKKQGIEDDEEQRLLSNLRVKVHLRCWYFCTTRSFYLATIERLLSYCVWVCLQSLSVQASSGAPTGWTNKQRLIFAGCILVAFLGLVALITTVRSNHYGSEWAEAGGPMVQGLACLLCSACSPVMLSLASARL